MKYQIKKRFTNEVMFKGEAESFVKFVEQHKANLSKADLSETDLSEANLSNSDLSNSNLSNSDLSNSNLSETDLSNSDLYKAKIKITQKEDLLKALKIEILE